MNWNTIFIICFCFGIFNTVWIGKTFYKILKVGFEGIPLEENKKDYFYRDSNYLTAYKAHDDYDEEDFLKLEKECYQLTQNVNSLNKYQQAKWVKIDKWLYEY